MEKMIKKPLLIKGDIMHHRFLPKKNHFDYKSTYISFPISQTRQLKKALFSLGKFNLFGFYNSDYGNKDVDNLRGWLDQILKENSINNIEEIILVTHPRVVGYVFNPVSFWLCLNDKHQLIAVLSEVNNTCGQKHNYLCFKDGLKPIESSDWIETKKEFYVSPFMKIEGKYKFRFEYKKDSMSFYINYLVKDKLQLSTLLKCNFQEFNSKNLLVSFLKMPFFTFKTIILIHYQAIKLYLKSIKYYKCPEALKKNITISKNEK
tara:strand:- start:6420 stop:7205 length:786 start_codon:yes stop_codon:yes gene_type:complete